MRISKAFAVLARLTDHSGLRPALEGILFRGCRAWVSDGYKLVGVDLPEAVERDVLLKATDIEKAVRGMPKKAEATLQVGEQPHVVVRQKGEEHTHAVSVIRAATYDPERVWPEHEPQAVVTLGARHLRDILEAIIAWYNDEDNQDAPVSLYVYGQNLGVTLVAKRADGSYLDARLMPFILGDYYSGQYHYQPYHVRRATKDEQVAA